MLSGQVVTYNAEITLTGNGTATPEPGSMTLLGLGGLGLLCRRLRE
jgi:MYXO-CTERM domain-containing protein